MTWTRRRLLGGGLAAISLAAVARARAGAPVRATAFPQSVASGDPTPSGAVVWTRVAPEAYVAGRALRLEVAGDPSFAQVVASERIPAEAITSERDHTVRVDLDGRLRPDRVYVYRFVYGDAVSPLGRLRTLPSPDAAPERLRLALASCQDYGRGHFTAYDHLVRWEPDFLLHVGDFLYESFSPAKLLRGRALSLPSGETIAQGLEDYRALHRTYRGDAALRRALERHTLIAIWDDHEVANDRYRDPADGRLRAPDHPLDGDPTRSRALHEGGMRAWLEYVPTRAAVQAIEGGAGARPRLERGVRFGSLAELFVSESRLARDPHPCGEKGPGERFLPMEAHCPERRAPGRTMLGEEQRRWLVDGLAASDARWKLWATSVPLTPVGYGSGEGRLHLTLDTWAGYEHERRTVLEELHRRDVRDLVSLTGDLHAFFAARLFADEVDPLGTLGTALGVELATGPLSAVRLGDAYPLLGHADVVLPNNPQIAFWSAQANGYATIEVRPDAVAYEALAFAVDRPASDPVRLGRYRVAAGTTDLVAF